MLRTIPGLAAAFVAVGLLAACDTAATSKTDRAVIGAGVGAVAGEILDDKPLAGAVVGGAAGYFCDDLGVCRPR